MLAQVSNARRLVSEIRAVARFAGYRASALYLTSVAAHLPAIFHEHNLRPADAWMEVGEFEARVLGHRIRVPGEYFSGAREMYGRKVYFAPPGFRVHSGDVAIDLGAAVGLFTVFAAKAGANVVAVEAQSGLIPIIREILRANGCEASAHVEWAIVGPKSGMLSDPATRLSSSHYVGDPPTLTLNELVSKYALQRIDFLKIDIEGSEFDAFARDLEWLQITRKIAMEVHPEFGDPQSIASVLRGAGFQTTLLDTRLSPAQRVGPGPGYLYAIRR